MRPEPSEPSISAANFAARLRSLREHTGMSLRKVAGRVGISAPFLSDIELGRRMPSREVACRIAAVLSVDADEILKFDPREGLSDILIAASANVRSRRALTKLCRRLNAGGLKPSDLDRLIGD